MTQFLIIQHCGTAGDANIEHTFEMNPAEHFEILMNV